MREVLCLNSVLQWKKSFSIILFQNLVKYLDNNPSIYRQLLIKKRHDELQRQGLFSMLKVDFDF